MLTHPCFHEDIAPVVDRTAAGIDALKSRNLMSILSQPFTKKWNIGPGLAPQHQRLSELNEDSDYDTEPRSKNEQLVTEIEEGSQQAGQ